MWQLAKFSAWLHKKCCPAERAGARANEGGDRGRGKRAQYGMGECGVLVPCN